MNFLFPDLFMDSIYEVPYEQLKSRGVKALLFDIDNTLVAFDQPEPPLQIIEHFERLKTMGFSLCLLSNNNEYRVKKFNEKLSLHAFHKAGKPKKAAVQKAMTLLGTNTENTVIIGDQIFTDIWCGKRSGLFTVLVKPVSNRDEITVGWKRYLERIVLNEYRKKVESRS